MRSTIEIRLSLNDDEWSGVAMRAFRANKPVNQWIKDQIVSDQQVEQRPTAPPVAPPVEPIAAAKADEAVPSSVEDLVRVKPDAARAAVVRAAVAEPEPAPPPPPAQPPAPVEAKRQRKTTSSDLVPSGFEPILDMAEKIHAGRMEVQQKTRAKAGAQYNRAMGDWYLHHGFGELPIHVRQHFIEIGQNAAQIRHWYNSVPPGTVPDAVRPYALIKLWKEVPAGSKPQTTIVFQRNRISRVPVGEAFGPATPPAANGVAEPESVTPEEPRFESFAQVDLDKLGDADRRAVRRFTEKVIDLGGPKDLTQDKIALAVRNIRGKDTSDMPKIAQDLLRLGVLRGSSGDFRIRREYADRFTDIVLELSQHR